MVRLGAEAPLATNLYKAVAATWAAEAPATKTCPRCAVVWAWYGRGSQAEPPSEPPGRCLPLSAPAPGRSQLWVACHAGYSLPLVRPCRSPDPNNLILLSWNQSPSTDPVREYNFCVILHRRYFEVLEGGLEGRG